MEEEIKRKATIPWEDDEIEFVRGKWEIFRDDTIGYYRYTFNGIEARTPVDGVQLIEWGMAKLLDYPCSQPWGESDIAFNGKGETIRYPLDRSLSVGEREYLIEKEGGFFVVNKYYLILVGFATAGEKTKESINSVFIPTSGEEWESDGIYIKNIPNVTIRRARSVGSYIISSAGFTRTRSAEGLIELGYAEDLFKAKTFALAKCAKINLEDLRKQTFDFWGYNGKEKIDSLRTIARVHYLVDTGKQSVFYKQLSSIEDELSALQEEIENKEKILGYVLNSVDSIRESIKECNAFYRDKVFAFSNVNIQDNIELKRFIDNAKIYKQKYEVIKNDFKKLKSNYEKLGKSIQIKSILLDYEVFPDSLRTRFHEIKEKCEFLQQEYKRIKKEQYSKVKKKDLSELFENIQILDRSEKIAMIKQNLNSLVIRQQHLDDVKKQCGEQANKRKKYLINKARKTDRIRFTTAIKIRYYHYNQKYMILSFSSYESFTADELIYMGLAERI